MTTVNHCVLVAVLLLNHISMNPMLAFPYQCNYHNCNTIVSNDVHFMPCSYNSTLVRGKTLLHFAITQRACNSYDAADCGRVMSLSSKFDHISTLSLMDLMHGSMFMIIERDLENHDHLHRSISQLDPSVFMHSGVWYPVNRESTAV